jgi:hypothetical protein
MPMRVMTAAAPRVVAQRVSLVEVAAQRWGAPKELLAQSAHEAAQEAVSSSQGGRSVTSSRPDWRNFATRSWATFAFTAFSRR